MTPAEEPGADELFHQRLRAIVGDLPGERERVGPGGIGDIVVDSGEEQVLAVSRLARKGDPTNRDSAPKELDLAKFRPLHHGLCQGVIIEVKDGVIFTRLGGVDDKLARVEFVEEVSLVVLVHHGSGAFVGLLARLQVQLQRLKQRKERPVEASWKSGVEGMLRVGLECGWPSDDHERKA